MPRKTDVPVLAEVQVDGRSAFTCEQDVLELLQDGTRYIVVDFSAVNLFASAGMERELRIELLTNRTTGAERKRILAGLASGSVDLAIGKSLFTAGGIPLLVVSYRP